jgi:hypothetical protein
MSSSRYVLVQICFYQLSSQTALYVFISPEPKEKFIDIKSVQNDVDDDILIHLCIGQ